MKKCDACDEGFDNKFSFCPLDGNLLAEDNSTNSCEYRLTLISDSSLPQRLVSEGEFLIRRFQRAWPQFTAQPLVFILIHLRHLNYDVKRIINRPHFGVASLTSITAIVVLVMGVLLLDARHRRMNVAGESDEELVPTMTIDFHGDTDRSSKAGAGTAEKGRLGLNRGQGEGSGRKLARAQGGGGGGDLSQLPQSHGRLPYPSVIPAPIPTTYARITQSLPEAGLNIDPVLWKDLPFRDYGDPRAKSLVPSNGPGNGGGVGTGQGTGVGEGFDAGFGPGRKGNTDDGDNSTGCCGKGAGPGSIKADNDPNRVFKVTEVTSRARVLSKPEPQYTEAARRGQITGTVVLSVLFSRTGQVTDIRAMQSLCCGLTEKAIAAARQIRFVPATREGQAVSTRMQLEYNFNLY